MLTSETLKSVALNIESGLVTKSLKESGVYSGVMPIQKHKDSLKFIAKIKK